MKLYHGSKVIIEHPIPKGSKVDNDYGPAFYLTRDLESAHEWACRNSTIGYVNEYDFDIKNLKVLDLRDKSRYSVLNWLAVLMHFRTLNKRFVSSFKSRLDYIEKHYYIDVNEYDIVIGYRADDAYFRFPIDFIVGNITLEQLEYSFLLGELGTQYVLISEKAFKYLHHKESFLSESKYIDKYFNNVTNATKMFDSLNKDEKGTRIYNLMEEDNK